ncbi:MAG TPA: hypothetical protein VM576_04115 [Xanthomonadaceae bacterium]|nr:hypothetical protein [Xanthomonadaceae bacterium]
MKSVALGCISLVAISLTSCATVRMGSEDTQAELKKFEPVPGKVSLYVCREDAAFVGAGNHTTVMVDNQDIGTLKPNTFAHAVLEPGNHNIYLDFHPGGKSGTLTIQTQANDVPIVWAGVTGHGWGVLTVDEFPNRADAENCIRGATYAVPGP